MATNEDLRPSKRPVFAGLPPVRALVGIALAAALAALLLVGAATRRDQAAAPAPFLQTAVGPRDADAPLVREALPGVRTALDEHSFGFERAGESVRLTPADGAGEWTRHADGAVRDTSYGSETIVFRGERGLEQFLTVERRQGQRTWSWQLDTVDLEPRLKVDGSIEFRRGGGTAGLQISPAAILDTAGEDVTPDGLRWSLAERGGSWWLELELDDAELPLPYVIDPAITQTGSTSTSVQGGTSITLTRPGNAGDLLVAQVSTRSANAIAAPAGWTLLNARTQGTTQQAVYWRIATGSEGLTWSWTGSVHTAGGIVAYANPHPTTPIEITTNGAGTGTTATATGGTATVPAEMIVALYSAAGNPTLTQTASQGVAQVYADGTAGGGAPTTRIQVLASDGVQAGSGAVTSKTATISASNDWVGHLVSIRQAPDDGDGTLTTGTTGVAASSTGNTITFTYTAGVQGIANGAVAFDVPASWSAPSLTTNAAGYATSSTGSVGVSGQRVTVTGVTLNPAATMTITYGSTVSGGPGATASAATGSVAWSALARGTSGGTLAALAASPSITQYAARGSGTLTSSVSNVAATSAGNTITFTYTAATGGMSGGAVRVTVPAGWSAPSLTGTDAGFTTASTGTVGVAAQVITVTGVTLAGGATMTITYGATGSGGPGATATS
ncbi:MAG TPA: hypothetical protein VM184_03065, partial [Gaiellaceae bacterium]|nr:hypothetical protein [Gaiellaceae bacterium]